MTKVSIKNKYVWILVALIILAATMGLAYLFVNNNNDILNKDIETTSNKNNASTQLGVETNAITHNLKSGEELQEFLAEQENDLTSPGNVGSVDRESIDWDTHELVAVEFYISSGETVKEISLSEQEGITATILKAPQGCIFPAVEVKQIQFLQVESGQQIKQNMIYFLFVENSESCDQIPML